MLEKGRLVKFLYHLGKGLWKSVPVLGGIVDEVVYEQFRNKLTQRVEELPDVRVQQLLRAIPAVDFEELEQRLGDLSQESQDATMSRLSLVLATIDENHLEVISRFDQVDECLLPIPSVLDILEELRSKSTSEDALRLALDEYSRKHHDWVKRISSSQQCLLQSIPDEDTHIDALWESTRQLLPECGYKEFRFRLHEFEWLGLAERYRAEDDNCWRYRRTAAGREAINV